eukprot:3779418-Rhodomonas_salina.1
MPERSTPTVCSGIEVYRSAILPARLAERMGVPLPKLSCLSSQRVIRAMLLYRCSARFAHQCVGIRTPVCRRWELTAAMVASRARSRCSAESISGS